MFTELVKERDALPATPVWPQTVSSAFATTGTIDMTNYARCEVRGVVGALGAATVTAWLQSSANSAGTSPTTVSGSTINAITTANKTFTIELQSSQLTERYLQGVISVASSTAIVAITAMGTCARYSPANTADAASVAQRLVVPIT